MERKVYFGNSEKQTWIVAPKTGLKAGSQGFISEQQLLNGRTFIDRSKGSHRRFTPSWIGSMNDAALENSLLTIKDFADGLYGEGPFYWIDPFAVDSNLMPPHWAAPSMTAYDWPDIWDFQPADFPATDANTLNYPPQSVRFDISSHAVAGSTKKLRMIIPAGYTLHFGWHGVVDEGTCGVKIDRHLRSTGAIESVTPSVISVTSSTRTNVAISGTTYSFIEIYLYKGDTAADFTVSGMIAQVLPDGASVGAGGFISGRGTTGIEFASGVDIDYYSSVINNGQIGLAVEWAEVE
jgi:hypothetical protein